MLCREGHVAMAFAECSITVVLCGLFPARTTPVPRLHALARIHRSHACVQGDGAFTVNGKTLACYFPRVADRRLTLEPLVASQTCGAFDVSVTVAGA